MRRLPGGGIAQRYYNTCLTPAYMIRIVPFTEQELGATTAFNARMRAGAAPTDFLLPESVPATRARPPSAVSATQFIAMEDGEARGGFIELLHPAWLNGSVQMVANYQSPLSEGICDKKYGLVGMQMIRYIQQQRPYLFVVGMGDPGNPLPRLLESFKLVWVFRTIPGSAWKTRPFRREVRTSPAASQSAWRPLWRHSPGPDG